MKVGIKYLIIGVLLGGAILFGIQLLFQSRTKTPFVSMTIVFEQSKIREKYANELNKFEITSNSRLAEIENQIREDKSKGSPNNEIETMEKDLLMLREKLSNDYLKKSKAFEKLIWDNINRKVSQYGKEKGFDYIFGANGDGSIMYASEENDITNEIIEYINQ